MSNWLPNSVNTWYQQYPDDGTNREYTHLLKVIIIGNSSVGKSTFLYRLADNIFIHENEPTIGVEFRSMYAMSKAPYAYRFKIQLWDTSGQDRFRSIVRCYYRHAQGCFLVFDITDRKSWTSLQRWYEDLKENVDIEDRQIVLLGSKLDLQEKREVTTEEGQTFAVEHGLAGYIEVSSNTGVGISQGLSTLVDSIAGLIGTGTIELEPKLGLGALAITDTPTEQAKCCTYM